MEKPEYQVSVPRATPRSSATAWEGSPRSDDVVRVLETEACPKSHPHGPDADRDEDRGADETEREAKHAAVQQPAYAGEAERAVEHVDERDGAGHREPDRDGAPSAQHGAHDQKRHRADLRRQDEAEREAAEEERAQAARRTKRPAAAFSPTARVEPFSRTVNWPAAGSADSSWISAPGARPWS